MHYFESYVVSIDLIFIYKNYIMLKVNMCLSEWTNRVTKTTYFLTSLIISPSTDLLKTMSNYKNRVTKITYFLHWLNSSHLITIFNIIIKCMVSTWSAFSTLEDNKFLFFLRSPSCACLKVRSSARDPSSSL